MSVKVFTYGGRIGWLARKYVPNAACQAYLKLQYMRKRKMSQDYIDYFCDHTEILAPQLISIETINRCNGTCAFCSASKGNESRPFYRMEDDLFQKIIDELAEMNYSGYLSLYVINEPFMDTRIISFHKYAREKLPNATMLLYSNGLLLDIEKFNQIAPYVDIFTINNYCDNMKLHKNIEELYNYLKHNPSVHEKMEIKIEIRYNNEVLTNRAGNAPNRQNEKRKVIKEPCVIPYSDMTIYSNGVVGLCCCDTKEVTNLGNLNTESIQSVWSGQKFREIREKMRYGRNNMKFCESCDFVYASSVRVEMCKNLPNKLNA